MSSDWAPSSQGETQQHEYETVAELYISSKSGTFTSMRKVGLQWFLCNTGLMGSKSCNLRSGRRTTTNAIRWHNTLPSMILLAPRSSEVRSSSILCCHLRLMTFATEKSSWLGMSRAYATTASGDGQWVRVRCTLTEMEDTKNGPQWRLTIVGDKVCGEFCPEDNAYNVLHFRAPCSTL